MPTHKCKYCDSVENLFTRLEGNFLVTICQCCLDDFGSGKKVDPMNQAILDGQLGFTPYLNEQAKAALESVGYNTDKCVISKPIPEPASEHLYFDQRQWKVADEITIEDIENMRRMLYE